MKLLNTIDSPADLRKLPRHQLPALVEELRSFIIQSVSRTGGHLSSNLGIIELSVALHYVFNTPDDRLIWDVGHQCYAHKILTGRREQMKTLRQLNGLSGFPKREESEYDAFSTAHSSTSISAALGMAMAAKFQHNDRCAIAVIGDGAITGGMAFEAMNNVGIYKDINLLVILNDNDMSISPPVGVLNRYFTQLMGGGFYAATEAAKNIAENVLPSPVIELAKHFEKDVKGLISPKTLFDEFGFSYTGPIDGHDTGALLDVLQDLKKQKGPRFLHIVTKKGHGYKLAEADPTLYHGLGKFSPEEGLKPKTAVKPTFSKVFGDWLCDTARQDSKLIGITPAMSEGSGMVDFAKQFPDRFFDVGIAEQHAVTFAAGLACEGLKPVVAIYSTFLQRAYDQLIHDVALQDLDVTFAIDRAGLVGADGATHAGSYDMAYLRCIPNMVIMAPSDENESRQMLTTAYAHHGPATVRYPRGTGIGATIQKETALLPIGKALTVRKGAGIAILAFGTMLHPALEAGEKLDATVINMRFIKPIDRELVIEAANHHHTLVTVEEGTIAGGAGSAVLEVLSGQGLTNPVIQLGLPDRFIDHGDIPTLLAMNGLDGKGIEEAIRSRLEKGAESINAVQPTASMNDLRFDK
ncbi:MAG: 1-deoxy-D-xylulose-5-phosphate synthase [Oxalobacter sp.]|nr:1-deoxy-D-xylulose-5-phosphate synthase [Oxalobacter sp.]